MHSVSGGGVAAVQRNCSFIISIPPGAAAPTAFEKKSGHENE